ncbi:MAG: ATP-binding protein [Bacteroidota bacterium]|nr:ATP-binding protein [Bacteroidota bacterium]
MIRILLMVVLALLLGYVIFSLKSVRIAIICLLFLAGITVSLISSINTANKKIKYFFESVSNDDSNLSFPVDEKNAIVREIYRNMNRINQQIQQLKINNINQEQYFRALIEHLAIGIITFNDRGFILHSNTPARNLLRAGVLTHIKQIERTDRKLYQAVKNIKPSDRQLVPLDTEWGEVQLALKATSLRSGNDELTILSIQDIRNELDEKEVESWMKLIRVLMHEIMNSITPITSLSESLSNIYTREGKPVSPDHLTSKSISTTLQGLNVIKTQGRGLMSFVDSYRKLTGIPEPDRQLFKVAGLLDRVRILYDSLEGHKKVGLSFNQEDSELQIYADQNLISQVLINLVKNALESNENNPGGSIMIHAGLDNESHPEICVSDNGPGIPEENLDEIFVPFFTTRQSGSGIGLSISRQIMRMHGGNLKVRSVPGIETVFCLTF